MQPFELILSLKLSLYCGRDDKSIDRTNEWPFHRRRQQKIQEFLPSLFCFFSIGMKNVSSKWRSSNFASDWEYEWPVYRIPLESNFEDRLQKLCCTRLLSLVFWTQEIGCLHFVYHSWIHQHLWSIFRQAETWLGWDIRVLVGGVLGDETL